MKFDNDVLVRIKIPGHRTFGRVVETVAPFAKPRETPARFYTQGGRKPEWTSTKTDTLTATETVVVQVSEGGTAAPLWRVPAGMLESR